MTPIEPLHLETSGSTGVPNTWFRTSRQVEIEARLMIDVLVGDSIDAVVNFADPDRLYGRIFGRAIPGLLDVDVVDCSTVLEPTLPPEGSRHPMIVAVPSTWSVLRRTIGALTAYPRLTIVNSAGRVPVIAGDVCGGVGNLVSVVDVFGSTETGGIATRAFEPGRSRDWELLPDTELLGRFGVETKLRVSSPRIASPDGDHWPSEFTCQDTIVRTGDRTFEHLGRVGRIIKVDGRLCDLDEVERRLERHLKSAVACVPCEDDRRGTTYQLFVEADSTPAIATGLFKVSPHRISTLDELPRIANGKVDYRTLARWAGGTPSQGGEPVAHGNEGR